MLVRIAESNVGRGMEAVVPLPTVDDDRLDLLAYDGTFTSILTVQGHPTERRPRMALGPGYEQFVSVAPRLEQVRIIAYHTATGAAQLISLHGVPLAGMQLTSGSPSPLPNLTGASTHLISGIKPDGTFSWPFVLAYNAHSRNTRAYVWGWTLGVHRWIAAPTTRLPAGITSMTALRVGRQAYIALVIAGRLEIYTVKVTLQPSGLAFSLDLTCAFDAWTQACGVRLAALDDGEYRRTIVAYDPMSGDTVVDRVEIVGTGQSALIASGASITRVASASWPARSLVGTVDHRLLRYGPDDGVAEVWTL